ncbi:hypothetical protein E2C01_017467 [Portunus trituberculatus]|uniref:Uncharacterized protein n=1 Tax=Portunus trituberculatus TaxID=210409 RepID=A0A5B7DTW3_PORTR|nr:hypothetical protein [Portunus trituberculatus]
MIDPRFFTAAPPRLQSPHSTTYWSPLLALRAGRDLRMPVHVSPGSHQEVTATHHQCMYNKPDVMAT